jgi:hypothetical protein
MFIRVKYGDDETLLCNPTCAIINLLKSIKSRTGHAQQPITIDLTDETGLVQELDKHRQDYASEYLAAPGTYVLVKKQRTDAAADGTFSGGCGNDNSCDDHAGYEYIPLLNNWQELLPGYRLHLQRISPTDGVTPTTSEDARRRQRKDRTKSDSPAGMKPTGRQQTTVKDRAPSRRR